MRRQLVLLLVLAVVMVSAGRKGKGRGQKKNKCKYDYPTVWPTCDATTNQATVSLVVKEGSPAECAPTQDKELTCDKLERIKAWQARKDAKKAKKEESKRLKEHKKTLKEKYSAGCEFDVTYTDCNTETNTVTKTYELKSGDATLCALEPITYSCEFHEKMLKADQKKGGKRNNRRKGKKNKRRNE